MASRAPEKTGTTRQTVRSAPPPDESTTTDHGTEGTPTVVATSSGACRLPYLPPEILFNILELTDLIAPTGEVYWNPVNRYHLPGGAAKGTAWEPPAALFLVNRALSAAAHTVFLGRNRLIVRPDNAGFYKIIGEGRKANVPQLYGAREFLTRAVGAGNLPRLRKLEFHLFPMVDREVAAEARRDWLDVLDQINPDGGGGLNLRTLSISGYWGHSKEGRAWRGAPKESGLDRVRQFIADNIWGFVSPDGGPPLGIGQQFWVELRSETAQCRYSIRMKDQDKANPAYWDCDWGILSQSRAFAWGKSDGHALSGSSDGFQAGDWVEELWVKEIPDYARQS